MSDPIAVSILSKLTSWYTFDTTLADAHGSNDMVAGIVSGYSAGLKAQQINAGSRVSHTFSVPPAFSTNGGYFTIGGWFNYTAGAIAIPEFGLFYPDMTAGAEAFAIVCSPGTGGFYAITWEDAGVTNSVVADPLVGAVNYPVRVSVEDSIGKTATSDQVIRIVSGSGVMEPGRYFVVATWAAGNRILYVDSINVDTNTPPANVKQATLGSIRVGRSNASCVTDQDECFFSLTSAFTQDEVTWLFNSGNGRSYAEVVAAAA